MTYKFEIVNNSLVITNTDTNEIVLDQSRCNLYYNVKYIQEDEPRIVIHDVQNPYKDIINRDIRLSQAVDATLTPFTVNSFIDFARNNLANCSTASAVAPEVEAQLTGPWDNVDGSPATQSSTDINYNGGNVGIGLPVDTAPTAKLDIQGTTPAQILLKTTTFSGIDTLQVDDNGSVWSSGLSNVITNTVYGFDAGLNITTGFRNTFDGNLAGFSNTTGSSNTFKGFATGFSNTTGSRNTFTGTEAGKFNTTGQLNTFTGNTAGRDNTTGGLNVYTGERAGEQINGSGNVLSGHRAGAELLGGSNNIMLGEAVNADLVTVIDQADDCIVIGALARVLANNAINEIVIGDGAIGNGSNTTTIGNNLTTNTYLRGTLNLSNLPTSSAGLSTGDIWNNAGVLNIIP